MNSQELYLRKVLPYLKNFKSCNIYIYEIKKIEQNLAESFNKKNIHEALDMPDFKYVKNIKLLREVIKLSIEKLKLIEGESTINLKNSNVIEINNKVHQIVTFSSGSVPKIKHRNKNQIFFMYQPDFKKIFYCGKLILDKNTIEENMNEFTDFKRLEI